MKSRIITLIYFLIFIKSTSAQISNGDFTNWHVDSLGILDPDDWECSNLMYSSPNLFQDSDRTNIGSSYSAKFKCVFDSISFHYRGGKLLKTDIPFFGPRPDAIKGYWKNYNPQNIDFIDVELTIYDSVHSTICHTVVESYISGHYDNWTPFSKPLNFTSQATPVTYDLDIIYTIPSHDTSSFFNVDDIVFEFTTDVKEVFSQNFIDFKVIQDDESEKIVINKNDNDVMKVDIKDLLGRTVLQVYWGKCNNGIYAFNITDELLTHGLYLCSVENSKTISTIKFLH
jgi:hypothetical protein